VKRASRYLNRTAILVRRQLVVDGNGKPIPDDRGNDQYVPAEIVLERCNWEPHRGGTAENTTDRQQQVQDALDFFCEDPAADIRSTDAVKVDGATWEITSPVFRFTGSRLGNDYSTVVLRKVTG
jgi:hypothetical protein